MKELDLIINDTNARKINQILDEVNLRKRHRCIYSTLSIKMIIHNVEKTILKDIPKNRWEHLTFRYIEGATDFPKKFKFEPTATSIIVTYRKRQWRLLEVDRINCNHKKLYDFMITPKALCESIVEKHFDKINE